MFSLLKVRNVLGNEAVVSSCLKECPESELVPALKSLHHWYFHGSPEFDIIVMWYLLTRNEKIFPNL